MDFYAILGVLKTATSEEIKSAYRKLAMKHHPDRNPGDAEACEMFKKVQEAYDTLSDSLKRADYDRKFTSSGPRHARANPFHSTFNWGFDFGGSPHDNRGDTIQQLVEITLEEAFTGVAKKVEIDKKVMCAVCSGQGFTEFRPCKKCSGSGKMFLKQMPFTHFIPCDACAGTGRAGTVACSSCNGSSFVNVGKETINVTFPKGVATGMQIRIIGKGQPSKIGGRAGDLYIVVMVKEHAYIKRAGNLLGVIVPLTYVEFVQGTVLRFKDLRGREIEVVVPKNSTPDTQLLLKGKGMPQFPSGVPGDFFVTLKLFVTQPSNAEHEELLKRLREMEAVIVPESNHFGR